VLIPDENVKDLAEIPDNIKGNLEIKPVKWIDEVLQLALRTMPQPVTTPVAADVGKPAKRQGRRPGKPVHAH
jgi:ATP-dependent Lon protease